MHQEQEPEVTTARTLPVTLPADTDLVVVGAGIAGLCAALAAAEQGVRVVVLDAHQPGGRAATISRDGFLLNVGPHALYRAGHLSRVLTTHGVQPAGGVVSGTTVGVLRNGVAQRVVLGPIGVLRNPVLRPKSRLRMAALFARVPRMKTAALAGRTVSDWLGDEPDDLQRFMEMFIRLSTYTHAPDQFDAGAAAGQLQLALKGVLYPHGGWATLVASLRGLAEQAGATVIGHAEVESVTADGDRVEVRVGDQRVMARATVIATGGPDTAARLTGTAVDARNGLTEPIAASCLDLGLRRVHEGIVLGMDQPVYLSPHAPLADLAPAGQGLVGVLRYLSPGESPGEPAASRALLFDVARAAGITEDDVVMERAMHRLVVAHGAPAAAGGGLAGRPNIEALGLGNVLVAGDWVGPSGLLADASAASGENAGQTAGRLCARTRS